MAKNVVAFTLSDNQAKKLLREIAKSSGNIKFTKHAVGQMRKRRLTPVQVLDCLSKGSIHESPCLDRHGNWKLTMERYACGQHIGCAVAVDMADSKAIVITAFWVND